MRGVFVAAGGGGDALAASIIHRAMAGARRAVVATYAWDRLAVDPVPGPRSAADFAGLTKIGRHNYAITSAAAPLPPFGSTLPRLADELDVELVLLDPSGGVTAMRQQLDELVELNEADGLAVVDVGGDVVASGTEPGLRSPLADGLVLAAVAGIPSATVLIAGPGLDGELTEAEVLEVTGHDPLFRLDEQDVTAFRHVFEWHPTEATALLAAAARGIRGRVEIRDAGLPVVLTDQSPAVYTLPAEAAAAVNPLARAVADTTSLDEAEASARQHCGFSEIDYERAKQTATPAATSDKLDGLPAAVQEVERNTAERGIDYLTFRRIAEVLALPSGQVDRLRQLLIKTRPHQYEWPLWSCHST